MTYRPKHRQLFHLSSHFRSCIPSLPAFLLYLLNPTISNDSETAKYQYQLQFPSESSPVSLHHSSLRLSALLSTPSKHPAHISAAPDQTSPIASRHHPTTPHTSACFRLYRASPCTTKSYRRPSFAVQLKKTCDSSIFPPFRSYQHNKRTRAQALD